MSDRPRPTMPSMAAVGNGNGHNSDDEAAPLTELAQHSEMKTPPHGVKRESFLEMPQEDKNSLIYEELDAIRGEMTRSEFARAAREEERKNLYESREKARDRTIVELGGKIDAAITDARSDRLAHGNDRREFHRAVQSLATTQVGFDLKLGKLPEQIVRDVVEKVGEQIRTATNVFESKHIETIARIDGVKRSDAETKQSLTRAHGRLALIDDRVGVVEMKDHEQDARIGGLVADLGMVPHKLDHRESLRDQTPEQIKQREENAAKGTGIRGDIARIDSNVVQLSGGRLALLAGGAATPTALMEIGKAFGPEWAVGTLAAMAAITAFVGASKKARARLAAWWVARRIKISSPENKQ